MLRKGGLRWLFFAECRTPFGKLKPILGRFAKDVFVKDMHPIS
jgi:hypothetical protein